MKSKTKCYYYLIWGDKSHQNEKSRSELKKEKERLKAYIKSEHW